MIVILCGPPATGKTTLATGLQERLADRGYEFQLLDSDEFSRRTYEQMYERVARADRDWILAGTFSDRTWQERFRALDDAFVVWVTATVETARERNQSRQEPIPEQGLFAMHAKFDPPREDVVIDTDDLSILAALDRLESTLLSWIDDVSDS